MDEKLDILLGMTDLVMLDIKHIDPKCHKDLTGCPNDNILRFAWYLDKKKVPVWIRHVVVPTVTDDESFLYRLGWFIGGLSNLKALDVCLTIQWEKQSMKSWEFPTGWRASPPWTGPRFCSKNSRFLRVSRTGGIRSRLHHKL